MPRRFAILMALWMLASPALARADGQADLERGVGFAKQGQWQPARRYLLDALRAMPADPVVLLNLGLAHDRMGGREAEAIAWFRAYLVTAPNAANVAQVKTRVQALDLALESRVHQLLSIAGRIAGEATKPQERAAIMSAVMRAQAESGDIDAASATERRLSQGGGKADWGVAALAAAHARRGDFAAAMVDARRPEMGAARSWALAEIAIEQAKRDDFSAARKTAGEIKNRADSDYAFSRICVLWARRTGSADSAALAEASLKEAAPSAKVIALSGISAALGVRGQDGMAAELLAEAERQMSNVQAGEPDRARAQAMLLVARAVSFPEPADRPSSLDGLDPLVGARVRRDLGALRNVSEAKAQDWIVKALEIADEEIPDTTQLMEQAKTQTPVKSGVDVAAAAAALSRALTRVRN